VKKKRGDRNRSPPVEQSNPTQEDAKTTERSGKKSDRSKKTPETNEKLISEKVVDTNYRNR
jgi:hypothetical protein